MSRVCESSGKRGRGKGRSYVRSGVAKKQGGIGLNVRGKTLRWFRPNLQTIRVLLPTSVIKKGEIKVEINGKMRKIPLVKATRGRQALYEKQRAEAAGEA